ncbi:MAG: tetratricopeptide repeat protein [Mariniblastus sp.]
MKLKLNKKALLRNSLSQPARYKLKREIGRGGMGVVYEAFDFELRRKVAIKLILKERLEAKSKFEIDICIRQLREEARFAAKLQHSSIVGVHRFFVLSDDWREFVSLDDGVFLEGAPVACIVMQFIDGCQLSQLLSSRELTEAEKRQVDKTAKVFVSSVFANKTEQPTREMASGATDREPGRGMSKELLQAVAKPEYIQKVASIGLQVADALAHAHSKNTLHNDIKPSNLMIDSDGNAMLTDFGMAADATDGLKMGGTRAYMAPEAIGGVQTERSDIFSLGATLYRLATNRKVYAVEQAKDNCELQGGRLEDGSLEDGSLVNEESGHKSLAPIANLRKVNPAVPKDLSAVVMKCLQLAPEDRYQTVNDLKRDLLAYIDGRSVSVNPMGITGEVKLLAKRNPVASLLAVSTLVALVTGMSLFAWQWQVAKGETLRANENAARELAAKNEEVLARKEADKSAKRSKDFLKLLQESFNVANPTIGLGAKATGKDILLAAVKGTASTKLDDEGRLEVLESLALIAYYVDENELAAEMLEESIGLSQRLRGEQHPKTLEAYLALGSAYHRVGKFDEAGQVALDVQKLTAGLGDKAVRSNLSAVGGIAVAMHFRGKYDEAQRIFEQVLPEMKEQLDADDITIWSTLHNYAMTLVKKKEFEKAKGLFKQAWEEKPKAGPQGELSALLSMRMYGECFGHLGMRDDEQDILNECLAKYREKLNGEHNEIQAVLTSLASSFQKSHKPKLARPVLEELLRMSSKNDGPTHNNTVHYKNNLATVLMAVNEVDRGAELLEELVDHFSKTRKPADSKLVSVTLNLASAYRIQRKFPEAIEVADKMYKLTFDEYGGENLLTIQSAITLGSCYQDAKQIDKAIEVRKKILPMAAKGLGRKHPLTQHLVSRLGFNLRDNSQYLEAMPLLREAMEYSATKENRATIALSLRQTCLLAREHDEYMELAKANLERVKADPLRTAQELLVMSIEMYQVKNYQQSLEWVEDHLRVIGLQDVTPERKIAALSLKGKVLIAMSKLEEAESVLLAFHSGLRELDVSIGPTKKRLLDATKLLVRFYDEYMEDEQESEKWREKLLELEK